MIEAPDAHPPPRLRTRRLSDATTAPSAGPDRYAVPDAVGILTADVAALRRLPVLARLAGLGDVFPLGLDAREEVQAAIGVDLALDVDSLAIYVQVAEGGPAAFLAIVRGRLPADLVERVAAGIGGTIESSEGRALLRAADGHAMLAFAPDGSLLAGAPSLVEPRLLPAWKPGKRPAGALIAPTGAVALAASTRWLRPEGAARTDLAAGYTHATLLVSESGLEWTVGAKDAEHLERARLMSEGAIALLRAGHPAARGAARVIAAVAASFAGASTAADAVIARAADLLALVDATTGDGTFDGAVDVNKRTRRVTARTRGAGLTDVVAAGGVVPMLGLLGAFRLAVHAG